MKLRNLKFVESTGEWVCNVIISAPGGWFALNGIFYRPETRQVRFPLARHRNVRTIGASGQTVNALRTLIETAIADGLTVPN